MAVHNALDRNSKILAASQLRYLNDSTVMKRVVSMQLIKPTGESLTNCFDMPPIIVFDTLEFFEA